MTPHSAGRGGHHRYLRYVGINEENRVPQKDGGHS